LTRQVWKVAPLLFFSGLCALVYQTVWLREFRLIFGASTYATGAVLAIFMAGLGAGSALLGRRADDARNPLAFYARLELFIAAAAAISPLLLWLVAKVYFASGGSPQLGTALATLLRLLLATLVLAPATLLMGGTLPAAARAVETSGDASRRTVAILYGVNTVGAVAGALLSTFLLLESLGNRTTLFLAVIANGVVAVAASILARGGVSAVAESASQEAEEEREGVSPRFVYAAAAITGFSFLLMELVWYRMLSPILGGTTYMFGLVLAVALAGIGLGGVAYALSGTRRASAGRFAITCSLEALAIALPFALGDDLAVFANVLRGLGALGFGGHVTAWALVTAIVVFPAAFVSGIQFPMLIALLGRGRKDVGSHIGAAYAWNTAGAIAGSLAGGFGVLPLLSAPTTWRLVAASLVGLAIVAAIVSLREPTAVRSRSTVIVTAIVAAGALLATSAEGPTAVWRHSGIGAARAPRPQTRNDLQRWELETRRNLLWDRDGRESSVAVMLANDVAFVVNGKSDGAARGDAETQVMLGMVPATLHPKPTKAMVVGLGTGESAGWLAAIPSMQRVDVVELEPVVLDVARLSAPLNAGALANPKLHVTIGDAREALLTSRETYDIIASEPSNPYRAGIASLLTEEFYEAARERLAPNGMLAQWVQTYSVHSETMATIYATLTKVFPHVQTWWTATGDVVLVASREPIVVDADALRKRLVTEPYRSAAFNAWRIQRAEAFLARMFANEKFALAAAQEADVLNTDDRTTIEFGFARSLDESIESLHRRIAEDAARMGADRPLNLRGGVDWKLVEAGRPWKHDPNRPATIGALAMSALEMARRGDPQTEIHVAVVRPWQPIEGDVILATLREKQGQHAEAARILRNALIAFRNDAWPQPDIMKRAIELAISISRSDAKLAASMYEALSLPFAVYQQEMTRRLALIVIAPLFDGCGPKSIAALRAVEPNPVWSREVLTIRANCYALAGLPEATRAWEDLDRFKASEPAPLVRDRKAR
jgi:spermidine synthase